MHDTKCDDVCLCGPKNKAMMELISVHISEVLDGVIDYCYEELDNKIDTETWDALFKYLRDRKDEA